MVTFLIMDQKFWTFIEVKQTIAADDPLVLSKSKEGI